MRLLLLKATIPGGAIGDLFSGTVQVKGYTRNGETVAPHTARHLLLRKPGAAGAKFFGTPAHASATRILQLGRETGNEHLEAYDPRTDAITHQMSGTSNFVGFTDAFVEAMRDPQNALVAQHNHPNSGSLSAQDLSNLAFPGLSHIVAHGHDGTFYAARIGDRLPLEIRGVESIASFLHGYYNSLVESVYRCFDPHAEKVGRASLNRAFYDTVLRIMHAKGYVDYTTSFAVPPGMREIAIEAMQKHGIENASEIFDRPAFSVRPKDGLGKVIREAADLARRRTPESGVD